MIAGAAVAETFAGVGSQVFRAFFFPAGAILEALPAAAPTAPAPPPCRLDWG